MFRRAVMRGAAERQLSGSQAEGVGGTTLDHRDRLKRLGGRAEEDDLLGIAGRGNDVAAGIDGDHNAVMDALPDAAPCRFGNGRRHACCFSLLHVRAIFVQTTASG
jgi:hypothetical protein